MAIENQALSAYSEYLAGAIEKAAGYTVLVNGRTAIPGKRNPLRRKFHPHG